MQKILVCITIQENSKRLMDYGTQLAKTLDGELHILHIRQGDTIFETPDSSNLFEELFVYGSELGGEVHFLCSNHVSDTICHFIKDHGITHLIIGHPPTVAAATSIGHCLISSLEKTQVITL